MSEQLSGRALDRAIAERLGYTVRVENADDEHTHFEPGTPTFILVDPNGRDVDLDEFIYVWEIVDSEEHAWIAAPAFQADANAQLAICTPRGWYLSYTGNTALIARDIGGGFAHTHRGDGATPQEAGARAILDALEFLARMEAHAE